MNKKQVGAFLKIMSKDSSRPILNTAYIDRYEGRRVMVATDGYKLAAVYLDEDAEPIVGKLIRREAIEKWYKLATGKSRLTGEELVAVSADDYAQHGSYQEGKYPEWQRLVPTSEPEGQEVMHFNAEFMKIVQDMNGADSIQVELRGKLAPMMIKSEVSLAMVMPMKV